MKYAKHTEHLPSYQAPVYTIFPGWRIGGVGVSRFAASANHSSEKPSTLPPNAAETRSGGDVSEMVRAAVKKETHEACQYGPMQLDRKVVSMSSEGTAVAGTCSSLYSISPAMIGSFLDFDGLDRGEEFQMRVRCRR